MCDYAIDIANIGAESDGLSKTPTNPLYKIPGFPTKGWDLVEVVDHGTPCVVCEYCDAKILRYEVRLQKSGWGYISAGRVCAGKLVGDDITSVGFEDWERARRKWVTGWKRSQNGNWRKYVGDICWVIVPNKYKEGTYRLSFIENGEWKGGRKLFDSILAAKEAGFLFLQKQARAEREAAK